MFFTFFASGVNAVSGDGGRESVSDIIHEWHESALAVGSENARHPSGLLG